MCSIAVMALNITLKKKYQTNPGLVKHLVTFTKND